MDKIRKQIADRIKGARLDRNYTMAEVSEAVGIPTSTLSTWETGTNEPRLKRLRKLADFYELPLQYFMDFDLYTSDSNEKFEALSDEGKKAVMEYIDFIYAKENS